MEKRRKYKKMKVGFIKKKIQYIPCIDLIGYGNRKKGAEGVHDNLYIKCLYIDGYYFITCDLLALSTQFCKQIKSKIKNVSNDHITISCTHTHSGPASLLVKTVRELNFTILKNIEEDIIFLVQKVTHVSQKMNVNIFSNHIQNLSYNRANYKINGGDIKDWIVCNSINIILFENKLNNNVVYIAINFSCHPVILGNNNFLYTNDYIYYIEKELKKIISKDIEIIFWNGCCGNVNPLFRGNYFQAEKFGKKIALEIIKTIKENKNRKRISNKESIITYHSKAIRIDFKNKIDKNNIEHIKEQIEENIINENNILAKERLIRDRVWINRIGKLYRDGKLSNHMKLLIKYFKIEKKIIIITFPFEVFWEMEKYISNLFPDHTVFIICYADGVNGYLFPREYYKYDIYEKVQAHRFYGIQDTFSEDTFSEVLRNIELLKNIKF